MSGRTKKPIDFGARAELLEKWAISFGVAVIAGLLIECVPELLRAYLHHSWPSVDVMGNVVVTLGVAGEVFLGGVALRATIKADREAEERVANLNAEAARLRDGVAKAEERAAEALRAAAEADLARAKLEQRMRPRNLFGAGRADLEALLSAQSGMSIDIVVYDIHVSETQFFGRVLMSLFVAAKWRCRLWEARKAKGRVSGASTMIAVAEGHVDESMLDLAKRLRSVFLSMEIECDISPGRFSCKGDFEPGDFEVVHQYPTVQMGKRTLSPLRIQIGTLQLVPVPPTQIFMGKPGPKPPT